MSASRYVSYSVGIMYPDDLTLLKGIYDDICLRWGLHCGSAAAEDVAGAMMNLFGQGVSEEAEIRESLDLYLGRKYADGEQLRLAG